MLIKLDLIQKLLFIPVYIEDLISKHFNLYHGQGCSLSVVCENVSVNNISRY